jgi:hypothetical protein
MLGMRGIDVVKEANQLVLMIQRLVAACKSQLTTALQFVKVCRKITLEWRGRCIRHPPGEWRSEPVHLNTKGHNTLYCYIKSISIFYLLK